MCHRGYFMADWVRRPRFRRPSLACTTQRGVPGTWKRPIRPRYRHYRRVLCPPGKLLAEAGKLGRTYIRAESFKRQFRWSYQRHLFLDERFDGYCSFRSTRTSWNCFESIVDDEHWRFDNALFRFDVVQFEAEHVAHLK